MLHWESLNHLSQLNVINPLRLSFGGGLGSLSEGRETNQRSLFRQDIAYEAIFTLSHCSKPEKQIFISLSSRGQDEMEHDGRLSSEHPLRISGG